MYISQNCQTTLTRKVTINKMYYERVETIIASMIARTNKYWEHNYRKQNVGRNTRIQDLEVDASDSVELILNYVT